MLRPLNLMIAAIVFFISYSTSLAQPGMEGTLPKLPEITVKPEITPKPDVTYKADMVKNDLDYPADVIVGFVETCSINMMRYMPMHQSQSRPISMRLCSCLIDQFRSDFDLVSFKKGGTKLAQMMGQQYSETCKQLIINSTRS